MPNNLRLTLNTWQSNFRKCTKYLPPKPKFVSGLLYDQHVLRHKAFKKSEMSECAEWHQTDREKIKVKCIPHTLNKYPRGQNVCPFCSMETQGCWNLENWKYGRKSKNWKYIERAQDRGQLTSQSKLCALCICPLWPKFCPFRSTTSRFEDIAHFFYNFPLTTMLNGQRRTKKCMPNIQNWNFTILLTTLQRPFLGVCLDIWKWVACVQSEEMSC